MFARTGPRCLVILPALLQMWAQGAAMQHWLSLFPAQELQSGLSALCSPDSHPTGEAEVTAMHSCSPVLVFPFLDR